MHGSSGLSHTVASVIVFHAQALRTLNSTLHYGHNTASIADNSPGPQNGSENDKERSEQKSDLEPPFGGPVWETTRDPEHCAQYTRGKG